MNDQQGPVGNRSAKRLRREESFEWCIRISSAATFRTFVGVLKEILINCKFHLEKTPNFTGICVDSVDPSLVCMVKARFECKLRTSVDDDGDGDYNSYSQETIDRINSESFCVPMDNMKTMLKDTGDMLEIARYSNTAPDITLHSYDRNDPLNCTTSRLSNIEDGSPSIPMDPIGSEQMVEIELPDLKSLVKTARELKATHMRFMIETPARLNENGTLERLPPDDEGVVHNLFTIGIETEGASTNRTFHSITQVETAGGDTTLRALSTQQDTSGEGRQSFQHTMETFNELFSTTYMDLMLKSMDRERVQLFMAPEMPMIIKYGLGSDMSYLKVILAPKISNDE